MARPREFDNDEVLDGAMDVFWSKGYAASSARDLCEGTGLGRGSLYNAFKSKHHLYEEVLLRYYERGIEAQVGILEKPGPAKERLRELMTRMIDIDFEDPERRGCLAINAAVELGGHDPKIKPTLQRHFARVESAIRTTIERGQHEGDIDPSRPARQLARLVMSAYYGLRVLDKVSDNRNEMLEIVEGTLDAI